MDKREELYLQEKILERESFRESLRYQLQEATLYNRFFQNLCIGIAFTAGTLFFAMLGFYSGLKGNPDEIRINDVKLAVAVGGIAVSAFSFLVQLLSMQLYKFSLRVYVYPVLKQLGILPLLTEQDENFRTGIERKVAYLLLGVCVVYLGTWLWIFFFDVIGVKFKGLHIITH